MPISDSEHYRVRVFTPAINDTIRATRTRRSAALQLRNNDDRDALEFLAVQVQKANPDIVDHRSWLELRGAVEWYVRNNFYES